MRLLRSTVFILAASLILSLPAAAGEWANWRGPLQNGVSTETGLIDTWSQDGENLVWRHDFSGRSTPVVLHGRVCANGRAGAGPTQQEMIACWDAGTGEKLWERRYNVYNTTVPFNRVGWGNVTGDLETGTIYAQNVDGQFVALDSATGETVWEHRLHEDFGRVEGYGGRTHTPIVDEDRVIVAVISASWGENARMQHRYFAFDKRTGDVLWVTTLGPDIFDKNTYSMPSVAVVGGQRLLIGGTAGGAISAVQARTGKPVWDFQLSLRGVNSSVVVEGNTVYAGHSHENRDEGVMGRLVAIDATGEGDVTATEEKWRFAKGIGHATPLLYEGRLYVVDNSANLYALDAADGSLLWEHNFGTVGKTSPVFADGKIYLPELNGNFYIFRLKDDGVEQLDHEHIEMPDGKRYAEIYGSVAVAYGRIYFTTEEGIYCLGDKTKPFKAERTEPVVLAEPPVPPDAKPAHVQVVPADVVGSSGEPISFSARAYDAQGRLLGEAEPQWSVAGLEAKVGADGTLTTDPKAASQVGHAVAKVGELEGRARVRLSGSLPWEMDFDAMETGTFPPHWMFAARRVQVDTFEGAEGKVLRMPKGPRGVPRATVYLGPAAMTGYTVQVDLYGTQERRSRPDLGVINGGYTLDLQGNHQRIEIRSWAAMLRMAERVPFAWDMDTWYTVKMRVDVDGGKALVRGKVWKRGEKEPEAWTIEVEDALPIESGSPGIYGYTPVEAYFDNLKVTPSK